VPTESFNRTTRNWASVPIKELGLTIQGTPLEPVLAEFVGELERAGVTRVRPVFHLSTEWGVVDGTVAIGIPFYLAHPELTHFHAERVGFIEGYSRADILRYLRHEMGHVVNYAYLLHEQDEWARLFGRYDQPYVENYKPSPFSRRFVQHLPGWYAQKHPDEDWAETFAVWMTPGRDWRAEYADWPGALAKLEYCDRTMKSLRDVDPPVNEAELDEDVADLAYTLDDYYKGLADGAYEFPRRLDWMLKSIFEDEGRPEPQAAPPRRAASALIRQLEPELLAQVFRWTGHFPEGTRLLLRHLAERAEALHQVYPDDREPQAIIALTTLVSALAMNHVHLGSYIP
jgi:hypothetical protein